MAPTCLKTKKARHRCRAFEIQNEGLRFGDAGDLVVFAVHFDVLADEFGCIVSAFGGRCQGQLGFLAIFTHHDHSFGGSVEGLQFAFIGDDFAATSVGGTECQRNESESSECFFHISFRMLVGCQQPLALLFIERLFINFLCIQD